MKMHLLFLPCSRRGIPILQAAHEGYGKKDFYKMVFIRRLSALRRHSI